MSLRKLSDYKQHKIAKIIVNDLDKILLHIDKSINSLNSYRTYIPVRKVLNTLQDEKLRIELHRKKYKDLMESTKV